MINSQLPEDSINPAPPKKPSILRRLGCSLLLVVWFLILLAPCTFFYLAINGQIMLEHANVPDPAQHPFLKIQTVMEIEDRGFAITRSLIDQQSETEMCLETYVNYVFWQSSHNESQDAVFCDCYMRGADAEWELVDQLGGVCD
ncbi:MAG: hypothetical protein H6670_09725 [Anaerolineaceae bacterium]|nr:hypothetical protein [Anaerolineaceae bacterium]